MAVPTLAEVRALAIAWWTAPGLPKLEDLKAQIAQLFADPTAIVRASIQNLASVYTLVVELEKSGTVITRSWTPTNGQRQETLADIFDQSLGNTPKGAGL